VCNVSDEQGDDSISLLQLSHDSKKRSGALATEERGVFAVPFYMNPSDMTPGVRDKVLEALYPVGNSTKAKNSSVPHQQCPKCDSFPSLITLNQGLLPCGLLDRLTNLRIWSQVAASLCARLEVPEPCKMLSQSLVGKEPLPADLAWSHYIEMRVSGDNSSLFALPDNATANFTNGTRVIIHEKVDEINKAMAGKTPMERLTILNYAEGGDFRRQAAETLRNKYADALRSLALGKAFHWNLHEDWLIFDWMILLPAIKHCPLVSMAPAQSLKDTTAAFYEKTGVEKGRYLSLHVRRGDAIAACDTHPSKVVDYVSCSLKQEGWMHRHNQSLVIFTDEQDGPYKAQLLSKLKLALGSNRTVLFGDPVIHDLAKDKDGPFKFATTLMLRHQAEAELFMDRTQCLPCGVCKNHCRGATFDEYVVRAQMSVTPGAAKVCNKFLQAEPPVESCPVKNNSSNSSMSNSEKEAELWQAEWGNRWGLFKADLVTPQ